MLSRVALLQNTLEIRQCHRKMSRIVPCEHDLGRVREALGRSSVVDLPGPRLCGMTALARPAIAAEHARSFDLESPAIARIFDRDQPMTALQGQRGLVVIDDEPETS
jgi:hypothetical protein